MNPEKADIHKPGSDAIEFDFGMFVDQLDDLSCIHGRTATKSNNDIGLEAIDSSQSHFNGGKVGIGLDLIKNLMFDVNFFQNIGNFLNHSQVE